jgi:hypothetical protein
MRPFNKAGESSCESQLQKNKTKGWLVITHVMHNAPFLSVAIRFEIVGCEEGNV